MKTTLSKIGNSKGVIIPAHIIKECGFEHEVSLSVRGETLMIKKKKGPRHGWAEALQKEQLETEEVFDFSNDFDDSEWTW